MKESNEPRFLRKLKGQYGGGDAVRHERPIVRPKKHKDEDDDDAPTYVVEESHDTISKAEYDALLAQTDRHKGDEQQADLPKKVEDDTERLTVGEVESTQKHTNATQQIASIGASTKRKLARIVGEDDVKVDDGQSPQSSAAPKTTKKHKKRVKLSFEEDAADG